MIGGTLFSGYYLDEGIRPDADGLPDADALAFAHLAQSCLSHVPASGKLGEAETEALIVFPILAALGWFHLPQQPAGRRREDVPDALLFLDPDAQRHALDQPPGMDRWKQAVVVNENKAWDLPLDRAAGKIVRTPASQALRYLRLADEHTAGLLR